MFPNIVHVMKYVRKAAPVTGKRETKTVRLKGFYSSQLSKLPQRLNSHEGWGLAYLWDSPCAIISFNDRDREGATVSFCVEPFDERKTP